MYKRLSAFDFDGCLMNTPEPDLGKIIWERHYGEKYSHIGWWGRKESLDLNVFDIKPFSSILNQLNREKSTPDTHTIILTSRLEKLRPEVQAILDANNIVVDELVMAWGNSNKGEIILSYIQKNPDLVEINVYDDRDKEIMVFNSIRNAIPDNITFNIYQVKDGKMSLNEQQYIHSSSNVIRIIEEEMKNLLS